MGESGSETGCWNGKHFASNTDRRKWTGERTSERKRFHSQFEWSAIEKQMRNTCRDVTCGRAGGPRMGHTPHRLSSSRRPRAGHPDGILRAIS